ncbi:MAG TPA: hypothetical protein DCZ95_03295 [Verrucomicrobia bacterium]|nr:MAG: hypothetical protein A2X46_06940 [Lentisphaerae bacterium GWF2_57_35]HBA83098.1 hypothetical protein [Verrucomicrobiota bacterium]
MKVFNLFGLILTGSLVLNAQAGGWQWSIEPRYRVGMSMELSGAGYANDSSSAALLPGRNYRSGLSWHDAPRPDSGVVRPPADDITQFADRTFDDGYVRICPDTNEEFPYTWYWGWEDAGQYDGDAQQLTFTRNSSTSSQGSYADVAEGREVRSRTDVLFDEPLSETEHFSALGAELAARYAIYEKGSARLDLALGLAGWWGQKVHFDDSTFAAHVREDHYDVHAMRVFEYDYSGSYSETYVYDDPFGVVPVTTPPYSGSYEDPGPIINELPTSRDVTQTGLTERNEETGYVSIREYVGGRSWDVANAVQVKADVNNAALRVGLAGAYLVKKNLQLFVQPQLSFNYVQASLDRVERLTATSDDGSATTLAEWRDSTDEEKWVVGLGVLGGVNIPLTSRWFVEGSAGYEWMTEKPSFDVGPSTVEMDLSAFEFQAGVGMSL